MSATNAEIARRGYEAVLRGDFDAVREFLDADVKWHAGDPSADYACQDRKQALEMVHYPNPADARAVAGV